MSRLVVMDWDDYRAMGLEFPCGGLFQHTRRLSSRCDFHHRGFAVHGHIVLVTEDGSGVIPNPIFSREHARQVLRALGCSDIQIIEVLGQAGSMVDQLKSRITKEEVLYLASEEVDERGLGSFVMCGV